MSKIKYPVLEFENYSVDEDGNVYNNSNKILKPQVNRRGYMYVNLYSKKYPNGVSKTVHRIVLATFTHQTLDYELTVNHKNKDKKDNRLVNLEWNTQQENMEHAFNNNLTIGTLTEAEVLVVANIINENNNSNFEEITKIINNNNYLINNKTVCRQTVSKIYKKEIYLSFLSNFTFVKNDNRPLLHEQIFEICKLLIDTNISYKEIAESCDFKVNELQISLIAKKVNYTDLTKDMTFQSRLYLSRNSNKKLSDTQIYDICEKLFIDGFSANETAIIFGLKRQTVSSIKREVSHKELINKFKKERGII